MAALISRFQVQDKFLFTLLSVRATVKCRLVYHNTSGLKIMSGGPFMLEIIQVLISDTNIKTFMSHRRKLDIAQDFAQGGDPVFIRIRANGERLSVKSVFQRLDG